MSSHPTGVVTFLFTDIEGSTRLWETQPEAMPVSLRRHDELLRERSVAHHGYVFKTVGDAFCVAFAEADDALRAALAIQQAVGVESWTVEGGIRVRMTLHTGTAEERDGDYFGPTLNRVARLLSAGHGGQTLLSLATEQLVSFNLPDGVELIDLGQQYLKDLSRPEHVFQLAGPGLGRDFRPLNTLNVHATNLPVQATPLVGREADVKAVSELILQPAVRLVTLLGPGGTGKTRLSIQVAAELIDRFAHGAMFVALAAIDDPGLVVSTIAQTLGVKESGSEPLIEQLKAFLKPRQMLLVMDNFEQVLDAAPDLAKLLQAAPGLKIITSSRSALKVYGEREYPLAPLGLPDLRRRKIPTAELLAAPAVALFVERAQATKPDFALTDENARAVAEICVKLDGLPLAIELAAARIKLLPPKSMLDKLSSRLKLLTGGSRDRTARQQTLRGAIDWSYELMTAEERALFARLSIFTGGCSLEAAEAVCNVAGESDLDIFDGVSSLVDKSLLRQIETAEGDPRFVMLETIREYADERLTAESLCDAIGRQHAGYFLSLAEEGAAKLTGPEQVAWLDRFELEHDNLRSSMTFLLRSLDPDTALRLSSSLWRFWWMHGHLHEGREWLEVTIAACSNNAEMQAVQGRALHGLGLTTYSQGDFSAAVDAFERSLSLRRQLDDKPGIAAVTCNLGLIAEAQGKPERAMEMYRESLSLAEQVNDTRLVATNQNNLGNAAFRQGDPEAAQPLLEAALTLFRKLGQKQGTAMTLNVLGEIAFLQQDLPRAKARFEECMKLRQQLGDREGVADVIDNLGNVALAQGDFTRAAEQHASRLALSHELGSKRGTADGLEGMARVANAQGRHERAVRLLAAADALRAGIGLTLSPTDADRHEREVTIARAALDGSAFDASWEWGRLASLDDALAYAARALHAPQLAE